MKRPAIFYDNHKRVLRKTPTISIMCLVDEHYCATFPMSSEQILEQYDELYAKYSELYSRQLMRSAMKVAFEMKRLAKSNRLLMPYLQACFAITNCAQSLYEPEIGADNAMEIIAYVESEEQARKFQHNYDEDHYRYTVHWMSACGYDNLAKHTATRNGYNSPVIHGAVDDGIHVCRRTGKLECIECFREYAFTMCLASGDYEMGEHHARLNATSTAREHTDDRRFVGYKNLTSIYCYQGRLAAAFDALRAGIPTWEDFHNPEEAKIDFSHQAELLCLLTGRESELPELLKTLACSEGMPEIPPREENAVFHYDRTINRALRATIRKDFAEAENIQSEEERFLLLHDNLDRWFPLRIQRIATQLLANEDGKHSYTNTDQLAEELRQRASKACQWSAIQSLDAMLHRKVRINPLGIPFPIDIGPYATEGTPLSKAQIQLVLPLLEKVDEPPKTEEKEKSPLESEIASWYAALEPLWEEAGTHEEEQPDTPFPKADELAKAEQELYDKITSLSPDTLSEEELMEAFQSLFPLRMLHAPAKIEEAWKWVKRMVAPFPDRGRPLAGLAFHGFMLRGKATAAEVEPATLGLPEPEELEKWITEALEKEPNRSGSATTAGMIFQSHGNNREAQRYFSRAAQIDRLNEVAATSLAQLYEEAERPKDALAAIELYIRAGGRHPGLLWQAMQIAFRSEMPLEFLSYYSAFTELSSSNGMLDAQRVAALCQLERWAEALTALDALDKELEVPGRDRIFVRALCQAELGEDSWKAAVDAGLSHVEGEIEGLLGGVFDPSEKLWQHLRADSDERLSAFEQFLFERCLVPDEYFFPLHEEGEADEELPERKVYRCYLRQPLVPEVPSYSGWFRGALEEEYYFAAWIVVADSSEEAVALALELQSRCYPLSAELEECEELDSVYYSKNSRVIIQGRRLHPDEEEGSTLTNSTTLS